MQYLNKYDEFIVESLLLLESNIVYSNRFKLALNKAHDPIAKSLLDIENKDLDVPSNYFDVNLEKNDFVTFTPDVKAREILNETTELVTFTGRNGGWLTNNMERNATIFGELGYEPKEDAIYKPTAGEIGEVISRVTSKESGKTFAYVKFPKGEGVYNNLKLVRVDDREKRIWGKNRQEVKVGRAARLLITAATKTAPTEREIELFVNSFKAVIDAMNDKFSYFDIVDGRDLGFWYNRKNYLKNQGSLGSSCQAPGRFDWLDVYIKNPDTVKLIILKAEDDPDKIVGRALLWSLDDGDKFMDYIYAMKDSDRNLFEQYAKENGWLYQSAHRGKPLVATIKPIKYRGWPSIDTMRCWDPKTGKISNSGFTGSVGIAWTSSEQYKPEEGDIPPS